MRAALVTPALLATVAVAACYQPPNTSPYPVSPTTAIERNDLVVPADLEVRSATYSVTTIPVVDGNNGTTSSMTRIRPLITLFATRKGTGEQLILIYEDLAQRKEPSQIIRVVPESR